MTVFKKYLKIANTYTLMILAYTAIFLGLAIFTGTYNSTSTDYKSMDVKVAIINRDKNTELINGFKDFFKTLYLIFDYPYKYYTFKLFEV